MKAKTETETGQETANELNALEEQAAKADGASEQPSKTAKAKKAAEEAAPEMTEDQKARQLVEIKLSRSREQSESLFVQVGMYSAMIPRGVPVKVPRYVAMHLAESEAMEDYAVERRLKAEEIMNGMVANGVV